VGAAAVLDARCVAFLVRAWFVVLLLLLLLLLLPICSTTTGRLQLGK
jgi:hypothetical protein